MLKARILSAIVMASVLLIVLFALPVWATLGLIGIVVLAAAWEWSALVPLRTGMVRVLAVLAVAAISALAWSVAGSAAGLRQLLWAAAVWWFVALLWMLLAPAQVSRLAAAIAGLLAIVPTGIALAHLRLLPVDGSKWLLLALTIVVAADTGAYAAGRLFGRVKLAPRISPGKTWEGVLGGLLLSMLIGALGARLLDIELRAAVVAALIAGSFSVVGDLTESMLKRHAGVKDSGALLPGHGGLLDRLDSLCAGIPVLLLCWQQFGVLP